MPASAPYARVVARLIICAGRQGHPHRVAELAGLLVEALESGVVPADADGAYVFALAHAAAQLLFLGRYEGVTPLVARADAVARGRTGRADPALLGWADDARSSVAMLEGDMGACLLFMESASRNFTLAGDLRQACVEDSYVGFGYLDLGLYEEAERALTDCLVLSKRLGLPHVVAHAQHNLGLARAYLGKVDEAVTLLNAAVVALGAQGDTRLESAAHRYLSIALIGARDLEAAEASARRGLSIQESVGPNRAGALSMVATVLLARGKHPEALLLATEAHSILHQFGPLDTDDALVRRTYAEALHAAGELVAARLAIADACSELLRRAEKISNPEWRRSFLQNVPGHARAFELAREWSSRS